MFILHRDPAHWDVSRSLTVHHLAKAVLATLPPPSVDVQVVDGEEEEKETVAQRERRERLELARDLRH